MSHSTPDKSSSSSQPEDRRSYIMKVEFAEEYAKADSMPRSYNRTSFCRKVLRFLKKDILLLFIVIAVILGFLIGVLANKSARSLSDPGRKNLRLLVGFPGDLFLRTLKMVMLPLVMCSLIVGLATLDYRSAGKIGLRALVYYLTTTLMAVVLGIVLVLSIKPGKDGDRNGTQAQRDIRTIDTFLDLFRNAFPENIVQSTIQQLQTGAYRVYFPRNYTGPIPEGFNSSDEAGFKKRHNISEILSNKTALFHTDYYLLPNDPTYNPGINILGVVSISIIIGIICSKIQERVPMFLGFITGLNEIMMELVRLIMLTSPIGILSLITGQFWDMENVGKAFSGLALYAATILSGLFIHLLISLQLVYLLMTRKNPLLFLKGMTKAALTGFGTASSSATIPITLQCIEDNNKVDSRVSRFVIPVGATINMDGTALYEAVAAIYIAQVYDVPLNLGQLIAISLTATLASIGAAGIPQAGLVTMILVLNSVGLPTQGVGLILSIDWLLDRFRTLVNILGDSYGAGIVAHLSRKELARMNENAATAQEDMLSHSVTIPSFGRDDSTVPIASNYVSRL